MQILQNLQKAVVQGLMNIDKKNLANVSGRFELEIWLGRWLNKLNFISWFITWYKFFNIITLINNGMKIWSFGLIK